MEQFKNLYFKDLFQEYVSLYLREYGEKKAKEIADKVNSSNKCNKLLVDANKFKGQLGVDNFVSTVLSSTSFSFAKAETVCLASMLLLLRWQMEIGTPNGIASEDYLNNIFFRIIDKCDKFKTHISANQNFFEKFYSHLKSQHPPVINRFDDDYDDLTDEDNKLILPGVGIDGIRLNVTKSSEIEKKYGNGYDLINHNNFSFEMYYEEIGISCYYKQSDPFKTIFFIRVMKEFEAYTENGVVFDLDSTITVADVAALYGRKQNYLASNGNNMACLDYDGLRFYVDKDDTYSKPGEYIYIQSIGII